jgi:hypothetical protein
MRISHWLFLEFIPGIALSQRRLYHRGFLVSVWLPVNDVHGTGTTLLDDI